MSVKYLMSRYASDLSELKEALEEASAIARKSEFSPVGVELPMVRVGLELHDTINGRFMTLVLS